MAKKMKPKAPPKALKAPAGEMMGKGYGGKMPAKAPAKRGKKAC